MNDTIDVHLTLTRDQSNSIKSEDTYSGLADVWYKFETDTKGNVTLSANSDGFEHFARYFLKTARAGKRHGYHAHHPLEFGKCQKPRIDHNLRRATSMSDMEM